VASGVAVTVKLESPFGVTVTGEATTAASAVTWM